MQLLRKHGEKQADAVARGCLTEILGFGGPAMGDDGAKLLADFIRNDSMISGFFVGNNRIGSGGTQALAESLKYNKNIWSVGLSRNRIGRKGGQALLDMLETNVVIRALDLFATQIDQDLFDQLAYLTMVRNQVLIPAAARCASLCLIIARRTTDNAGLLAILPKEIVKMIAMQVYATRKDSQWLNALSKYERTGIQNGEPGIDDAYDVAAESMLLLLRSHEKNTERDALIRRELIELDLSSCGLGDEGAEVVAEFLKQDVCVEELILKDNLIGPLGARALAKALKNNRTLRYLCLSSNQIEEEGAEFLIRAFDANVCITALFVARNNLTSETRSNLWHLVLNRNTKIPSIVRRSSLYLILARRSTLGAGVLAIFPKEIVRMIAMELYTTRYDPVWIQAFE